MKVNGTPTRTLEATPAGRVRILDQTYLPHAVVWHELATLADAAEAIAVMRVRGAPLIGVTAAYGMALALLADASDAGLSRAAATLIATRPTAVNLRWAVEQVVARVSDLPVVERAAAAWALSGGLAEADIRINEAIGQHGLACLQALWVQDRPLRIMTHCNAGWLATIDWGTALAPVYAAQAAGRAVFVWASETRPRNQGASLTAWELGHQGVDYAVLADNAAGLLLRRGEVDAVIVGADRVSANGDVANKIGTYLKALAAFDNGVPFYVAVPGSTIDLRLADGAAIPIEARAAREVTHIAGCAGDDSRAGILQEVRLTPATAAAVNPAFDVTPARLVTAFITERGIFRPSELAAAFAV